MPHTNTKIAIAVVSLAATFGAHAQTSYVRPAYSYPAQPAASGPATVLIPGTPLYVAPYVGVGVGYDDNLFLSRNNEKASTLYLLSPGFKADARTAASVLQLSYQAQIGEYAQSSRDNYVDHTARAQYDMAFDHRNFLRLGLDWVKGHDPRGSTDRPFGDYPDKYRVTSPFATYAFGAPGAQGRVELYAGEAMRRYLNNRAFTTASDRDTKEYGGAFYWRAMPRTYLMAEARRTEIDYKLSTSPLNADEDRYYVGATWEATAATTGTIKVGRLQRDFKNSALPDYSGASWEGAVTWMPRTYSKFDFYTARQTSESTGLGDFILASIGGVTWNHAWSSYVNSAVLLRYEKDDYQRFDRTDKVKSIGFKVGYRMRRWLTLGAEFTHTRRDSNLPQFEYDKNFYLLTATGSL